MRQETVYQITLIAAAAVGTLLFGAFLYRELYPEYKIYQNAYVELEEFRSTYTGSPPPPFEFGVKQIVIPKSDKGPETIDRCISCHVALQFEHFSKTMIARDVNGNILYDDKGIPKLVENPNYVWRKLDERLAQGEDSSLAALKVAHVGDHEYSMEKVLSMHPLIGRETRPFEFHPMDEYGCTVCHGGNGRGLTTDRAHGAVYDGQYEVSYMGPEPEFLEKDEVNDPLFSKAYNDKPGEKLLFQTKPLLVGGTIQSSCVQCHKPTELQLQGSLTDFNRVAEAKIGELEVISAAFEQEYNAVVALLSMRKFLKERGIVDSLQALKSKGSDYTLDPKERERWAANAEYLGKQIVAASDSESKEKALLKTIDSELIVYLGSTDVVSKLQALFDQNEDLSLAQFEQFLEANKAPGSAHKKHEALKDKGDLNLRLETARYPLEATTSDPKVLSKLSSDVDRMTLSYQRGKELFISQACYACHRIEGFARGGIGPELTLEGEREPWFIKESIVWPQADLKTSTMPNFRLDHEEVEDLMTFLLAQRLDRRSESEMTRRVQVKAWEAGKKAPWEEPVSPAAIRDVRKSMTVFATEGCAACHRLKGFESNYGFTVEKEDPDFDRLFAERQWFQKLFPEEMLGSEIVRTVKTHASEIDARISPDVRQGALLDELEERYPGLIETFYTNFKFALRAQDHLGDEEYKERVRRVLMMYVQEYGFGRLIGPRPNWSGVYRSDQWLMEHFWNPASLVARSIMPVFPFDNTKFLALTYMLDVLGRQNTLQLREIWQNKGFSPSMAYQTLCAQCHGENFKGNGPVAEWIYPIPKNLSNPVFLRNLTKDRAYNSLVHGIKGGPMPPWGEVAMDKPFADQPPVLTGEEITELVNWIFRSLPGERYLREQQEIRKWDYSPEDVIKELRDTGDVKKLKEGVSTLLKDQPLIASTKPVAPSFTVEDVFDKVPAPEGDPEPYLYYIKEKYYTPQNLAEGKAFFELNCAVCHGKDADGAGARAEVMEDAKPRMLINLPWLESRDDLRLIRSLVYGVAGTSMTPWGDQTTALQRLQLVMYIRSLTKTKRDYQELKNALYQDFQTSVWVVEQAREEGFKEIETLKKQAMELRVERLQKEEAALFGEERSVVAELYNQELDLREKLAVLQKGDDTLNSMITLLKKERDLYQDKGNALFSLYGETPIFTEFVRLIDISGNLYSLEEGTLVLRAVNTEKEGELRVAILAALDEKIEELSTQKKIASGKIPSAAQREEFKALNIKYSQSEELKRELITLFGQIDRIRQQQRELLKEYQSYGNRD